MINLSFDVSNYGVINIGRFQLWITETLVNTWIIMAILIIFAVAVRIAIKNFNAVPKGFQNVVEMIVEAFDNFLRNTAGEKLMFLGHWFFTVFVFLLISNTIGLFGLRPPTADWNVTFTFAIVTFFLIQAMGFKFRRGKYVRSIFLEPNPVFGILNIVGELARPVSLSFRLFGNILAGMILMSLLYLVPFVRFGIPAALHFYFDLFAGVLQAFIFCVLSLSFIRVAATE